MFSSFWTNGSSPQTEEVTIDSKTTDEIKVTEQSVTIIEEPAVITKSPIELQEENKLPIEVPRCSAVELQEENKLPD